MIKKILILAANPKGTKPLRFDEEVSKIKRILQNSKNRDQFEVEIELAIDYRRLRQVLLNYSPHIVHFIGHGEKDILIVEGNVGFSQPIFSEVLSELFGLSSNQVEQVECVILNACHSAFHATALSKHINYVIGMRKEIEDKAAIEFALGFYDALSAGKSVEKAFQIGCNALKQAFPDESYHDIPVLKKKKGLEKRDITEKPPNPPDPPPPELVLYLLFILMGLTFEVLYSFFRINLSQSFIMLCRAFYIAYIPAAMGIIIKWRFSKRKKSELERQQKEQRHRTSRTNKVSILERFTMYKNSMNLKQILISVFITFALFLSLVVLDFNRPIIIYWYQLSGGIDYLKYAYKKGDPEIDFNRKGNQVTLTSRKWNASVFWIKFNNYSINWDEYDKIYLKINYTKKVSFAQSAMLKLRLNDTTLSPTNGKVKPVGTEEDKFLIESKGSFYYDFKSSDLDQDNEITITLNRGKWLNFCIELALIKK